MIRNLNSITLLLLSLCCRLEFNLFAKSSIFHNHFCFIHVFPFLTAGCSLSTKVLQLPSSILGSPHSSATINCSHSISSYYTILWYQQSTGDSGLKLIGYIQYTDPTLEGTFNEHFKVTGDGSVKSQLHVLKLREPEDSGMYYCAASRHSDTITLSPLQKPSLINLQ